MFLVFSFLCPLAETITTKTIVVVVVEVIAQNEEKEERKGKRKKFQIIFNKKPLHTSTSVRCLVGWAIACLFGGLMGWQHNVFLFPLLLYTISPKGHDFMITHSYGDKYVHFMP